MAAKPRARVKILRALVRFLLLPLVLSLAAGAALGGSNAWTTGFPIEVSILSMAADPSSPGTVYAGTPQGLFKSVDAGSSWALVGSLPPLAPIYSLAIDPHDGTVYAGSHGAADVFRSETGGSSWEALTFGADYHAYPRSLAVDPSGSGVLYAGLAPTTGTGSGVLKSPDRGATWSPKTAGLPVSVGIPTVLSIVVDPAASAKVYVGLDGFGVYKSLDGAEHWTLAGLQESFPQLSIYTLAIKPGDSATLFAATNAGIFRSTDATGHWAETDSGVFSFPVNALVIDPANPATIFAGTQTAGVFRTDDGGGSWSRWNDGLTALEVLALAVDGLGQNVHAGTDTAVFDRAAAAEPPRDVVHPTRRRPSPRVVNRPSP